MDRLEDDALIPREIQSELEKILGMLSTIATNLIAEQGTFYPFGGYLTNDGQLQAVRAEGASMQSKPEEVMATLTEDLRNLVKESDDYLAVGTVANVWTRHPGQGDGKQVTAMAVEMEHRSGWACAAYVPYLLDNNGNLAGVGEMWVRPGTPKVFADGKPTFDYQVH